MTISTKSEMRDPSPPTFIYQGNFSGRVRCFIEWLLPKELSPEEIPFPHLIKLLLLKAVGLAFLIPTTFGNDSLLFEISSEATSIY